MRNSGTMRSYKRHPITLLIIFLILALPVSGNTKEILCLELSEPVSSLPSFESLKCQSSKVECCAPISAVEDQRHKQSTGDCDECFDLSSFPVAITWGQDRDDYQDVFRPINQLSRIEAICTHRSYQNSYHPLKQPPKNAYLHKSLQTTVLLI